MKVIATVSPAEAPALAQVLVAAQIAYTAATTQDESGLDVVGFMVEEDQYDHACVKLEEWDASVIAEKERSTTRRCPSCNSPRLEQLSDLDNIPGITSISLAYRCQDCGRVVAVS